MLKGEYLLKLCLFFSLVLPSLALEQTKDEVSIFETLKDQLEEEFAPDILSLNKSWTDFLQARTELNETASQKPWLTETIPGSNLFLFSLAGLANFKSKVMEMVEQKNAYLAQKTQLRMEMAAAMYNRSLSFFQSLHANVTKDDSEDQTLDLIRKVFGLDSLSRGTDIDTVDADTDNLDTNAAVGADDEKVDVAVGEKLVSGDAIIKSMLDFSQPQNKAAALAANKMATENREQKQLPQTPTATTKYPWAMSKAWQFNPWLNTEAAKQKQAFISNKIQSGIEKRQTWQQFAAEKFAGQEARSMPQNNAESVGAIGKQANGDFLNDVKAKLAAQFAPTIKALNDTRNEFLQAKDEMILDASKRAWEKTSPWGFPTFDPQALIAFKAKIADMVVLKNKYVAERARLKQDMLVALRDLMMDRLMELAESSESVEGPESTTSEAVESIVQQMMQTENGDVTEDIWEGLPFAQSLKLAAAPPGSPSKPDLATGGDEGQGAFATLIVLGVLAVVGSVLLLVGLAMKNSRRRSTYIHMT